jgi:hypothetical protein
MFKMCLPLLVKKKMCPYIYKNLDWFLMGKGEFALEICPWHFISIGVLKWGSASFPFYFTL